MTVLFIITTKKRPHFGYDIDPDCEHLGVVKADYLSTKITYLPGRLVMGNPPYGRCLNLAQKFYKKSTGIADYIAFILPISQLNNTQSMYAFDLIYSEDLGVQTYTDRELHCCFNIYRRPASGEHNRKKTQKLKDITIWRQDCRGYAGKDFDVRMCYWGNGSVGKVLGIGENYSAEYKIKIHNTHLKECIIDVLTTFDWKDYLKCISMKRLKQYHIIEVLKYKIPSIK